MVGQSWFSWLQQKLVSLFEFWHCLCSMTTICTSDTLFKPFMTMVTAPKHACPMPPSSGRQGVTMPCLGDSLWPKQVTQQIPADHVLCNAVLVLHAPLQYLHLMLHPLCLVQLKIFSNLACTQCTHISSAGLVNGFIVQLALQR